MNQEILFSSWRSERFTVPVSDPGTAVPEALTLLTLWRIVLDRKWLVATVTIASMLLGLFISSTIARTYTSVTMIVLEITDTEVSTSFSNEGSQYENPMDAVAVFGSRRVFGRVVDNLDLTSDPEFNPYLTEEDYGSSPLAAFFARFSIPTEESVPEGSNDTADQVLLARQATVDVLQDYVWFEADPSSTLIRVVAVTYDPARSAQLSDAVAEAFLEELLETRLDALDRVAEQLNERVSSLRQEVQASEVALQEFLNSSQALDADELSALGDQAQRLRARLEELGEENAKDKAFLAKLSAVSGLSDDEIAKSIEDNPDIGALFATASAAPTSQSVRSLEDETSQRLERQARLAVGLRSNLSDIEAQLENNSDQQVRLQQLQREVEANTEIYEFSIRRLNELLVQGGIEDAGGRIVLKAVAPLDPDGRGRVRTTIVLGVIGLVSSIGWILLREATNQTIRTKSDLHRILPRVQTVALPRAPKARRFGNRNSDDRLLVSDKSNEYSEAIRRLRGVVTSSKPAGGKICVQATSDFLSSGKSLVLLSLARSFSIVGKKVLLIDADMRDMSLSKHLGVEPPKASLQQLLRAEVLAEEAIIKDHELGLDLLLSAGDEGNPADLIESELFERLLFVARGLDSRYDVVLVDTPPLLVASEAQIVSELVDSVLFIAGGGASTSESVLAALEQLRRPLGGSDIAALYAAENHRDGWARVERRKFAKL